MSVRNNKRLLSKLRGLNHDIKMVTGTESSSWTCYSLSLIFAPYFNDPVFAWYNHVICISIIIKYEAFMFAYLNNKYKLSFPCTLVNSHHTIDVDTVQLSCYSKFLFLPLQRCLPQCSTWKSLLQSKTFRASQIKNARGGTVRRNVNPLGEINMFSLIFWHRSIENTMWKWGLTFLVKYALTSVCLLLYACLVM